MCSRNRQWCLPVVRVDLPRVTCLYIRGHGGCCVSLDCPPPRIIDDWDSGAVVCLLLCKDKKVVIFVPV